MNENKNFWNETWVSLIFIFFNLKDAAFINKIGVSSSLSTMYVIKQCKYKLLGLEF